MIRDNLDDAVSQCIEAAGHEIEPDKQRKLLKVGMMPEEERHQFDFLDTVLSHNYRPGVREYSARNCINALVQYRFLFPRFSLITLLQTGHK